MEQLGLIVMLMGISAGLFTILMIIFRPEQYRELLDAEERRKQAAEERRAKRAARMGIVAKGAFKIAQMILKK